MSRKTIFRVLAAGALLISGSAQASNQGPGTITYIEFTGSRVLFSLTGTRTTRPGCDCCSRWEIDGGTLAGQSQLSIILTAYALHQTVQIYGLGSCVGGSNDTEGINLLSIPS